MESNEDLAGAVGLLATEVAQQGSGLKKLQRSVDKLARMTTNSGAKLLKLDYEPVTILLESANRHERKRALAGRKEPWTVAWIERLDADGVLWDIGANVGAYSLIAALRPQGAMQVVSVEPSCSTYASLCRNVSHNRVGDRVIPLGVMLGATTGLGTFGYSDILAGAAFHAGGADSVRDEFEAVFEQRMMSFALDDLVETMGLPSPAYVKLDVDGAEALVLRGARRSLRTLRSLLIEISDRERAEVDALLAEAGLRPSPGQAEHRREKADGTPAPQAYAIYERAD